MMSGAAGTVRPVEDSSPLTGRRTTRGVLRRAAAVEDGVPSVVSMNAAVTVTTATHRVPLDERRVWVSASGHRSVSGAGDAPWSLGTDPVGDAVGGGGDLAGGNAVGRQRRPVGVEHVGVPGRRAEVVQLMEQATDLEVAVDLDLLQRVATQLAERPLPYRLTRHQRRVGRDAARLAAPAPTRAV